MYAQVAQLRENKSKAVVNYFVQKKSNERQDFGFVDNRHEIIAQLKLQEMTGNTSISRQRNLCAIQRQADFGEEESLETTTEERGGWGVIHKQFSLTLDEYVEHVLNTHKEPSVIQRAAVWNMPAYFAATDPALVAPLAGAPNSDARFNIYMQTRTPANFAGLDWGGGHRASIAGKLRRPAGFHEWAPVSQAPHMQANWFSGGGLNYLAYQGMRTPTGATMFATTAAPGVAIPHGAPGSPGAHGELFGLVTGNLTWAGFLGDLNNWAVGGLPPSVYRTHNGTVHNPPGMGW